MSLININFEAAQESQPAKNGRYNLMVTGAEVKASGPNSKNPGSPYINVTIGFEDEPNVPNIWHSIYLPQEGDAATAVNFKTVLLKRFNKAFNCGLRSGSFDPYDIAQQINGCRGNVEVRQAIYEQGNRKGEVYNELVLPKVPNE